MKCICCNKKINHLNIGASPSDEDAIFLTIEKKRGDGTIFHERAENRLWVDGVVGNISAGYGSSNDGSVYVIGVCDDCISIKVKEGSIAYTSNYICQNDEVKSEIENSKKIFRRNNNLDNLI